MTVNEGYLRAALKKITKIRPEDGISLYFTGMYNYVPAMPKTNIHAHDYYLYVKVFNSFYADDPNAEALFSAAIDGLLSKEDLVDTYIAYEILINQTILTNNKANSFAAQGQKMVKWFERILAAFRTTDVELVKCQYGIAKMYPDGLKGVINSYSELIRDNYHIDMSVS